jgi:hypothetical protein
MPADRSDSRKAAVLPTSSMVIACRRIGVWAVELGQQLAEVLDARRRQRLDGAGRDAVDAHAALAQVSAARKRTLASSEALARPMVL